MKMRETLQWYAEQVSGCRKIGAAGDVFRKNLDNDGGAKAREALVSPDATGKCGELVTVGIQYAHEHSITGRAMWGWQKEWKGCAAIGTRELVTRSQAVELLAAERAEKEELEKKLSGARTLIAAAQIALSDNKKLKADNAALTARIKELEANLLDAADVEPGEHQEILDALEAHNSGEEQ